MNSPQYYQVTGYLDFFHWFGLRPVPNLPPQALMRVLPIYAVGFRYVLRCLYKADNPKGMAEDCEKAADCFTKLAEVLRQIASEEQPPAPEGV